MTLARQLAHIAASRWLRLAALVALAGLAVAALYPASDALPRTRLPGPVEHFLAYGAAAGIAALAFRRHVPTWVLIAAMIAYAGLLEIAQLWAPGRSARLVDFLGSAAGAVTGATVVAALGRWIRR